MIQQATRIAGIAWVLMLGAWVSACDECEISSDCAVGQACIDGTCKSAGPFDPGSDSDTDIDADSDTDADTDTTDPYAVDWVEIEGGTYMMGYAEGQEDELPVHEVNVPTFEMARTEITAIQYSDCVTNGPCAEPATGSRLNWQEPGKIYHPINGVTFVDAETFCAFVGGRLPSEAEWEYAARSQGLDLIYPWGSDPPDCDYCIMNEDEEEMGCDEGGTWQVCSKPAGHTEQGLCDMSGNVYEWMADWYYNTYSGAPTDGSAWDVIPYDGYTDRTIRSGSYRETAEITALRTSGRLGYSQTGSEPDLGFRCARDVE
jgi:formylglycine-generating enzyme required for sulfatase activity